MSAEMSDEALLEPTVVIGKEEEFRAREGVNVYRGVWLGGHGEPHYRIWRVGR